jgi:hypothetical protein
VTELLALADRPRVTELLALADRPRVTELLALADFVNSSTRQKPIFAVPRRIPERLGVRAGALTYELGFNTIPHAGLPSKPRANQARASRTKTMARTLRGGEHRERSRVADLEGGRFRWLR